MKLLGIEVMVNATIAKINSFSGHADADQLIRRAKGFTTLPKKIFIMHGEGKAQTALAANLKKIGIDSHIPALGETIEI